MLESDVRVRAVTFDFWGTLYRDSRKAGAERRARRVGQIRALFAGRGVSLSQVRVQEALAAVEEQAIVVRRREQRTMTQTEIGAALVAQLGERLDEEAVRTLGRVVSVAIVHHPPEVTDGALACLAELEGHYRMALICDTRLSVGHALRQVMGNDLVLDYFETTVFSDEVGVAKPSRRAFDETVGLMGLPPEQVVHVGDSEALDVAGARNAGLRAVLVSNGTSPTSTQADAVVATLSELPAVLEALS